MSIRDTSIRQSIAPPLVSFIILTYNQEQFIHETIVGALQQDYEPLEIIISDDCSTDDTFAVVQNSVKGYQGPHQVIINRNSVNLGVGAHLNRVWEMTRGELIVAHGGDDISLPDRTRELVARWLATEPRPDLVFSNVIFINTQGEVIETQTEPRRIPSLEEVAKGEFFIAGGMAAAYSRHLANSSRPLDPRIVYEDYVLTFRALCGNGVAHIAKPLVKYRKHDASIMASADWSSTNRELAQKRSKHLPAEVQDRLQTWKLSGHSNPFFTWKLNRHLGMVKLDAWSCNASRILALCYTLLALVTFRPRTALTCFRRDVIFR